MMPDAIGVQNILGMRHRAVGKDMLAAGQGADHGVQFGFMRQVADINIMHKMQIFLRRQPPFDHQAAHCRAIALEQVLLDHPRLILGHLEMLRDKGGDSHRNANKQVRLRRIYRVVEVKHPVIDLVGGKPVR